MSLVTVNSFKDIKEVLRQMTNIVDDYIDASYYIKPELIVCRYNNTMKLLTERNKKISGRLKGA